MIVTIAGSAFSFSPNEAELGGINIELAAFDGTIGSGQFPIPDPSAAASMVTGRQFKVAQDFALLSDGFVIDNDRGRGPFRVGSQREYGVSIQDANALLGGFRVIRSRPAETDYARVIAFAALDGPTWDTTWVLNASTVSMPAKKYDSDGGWSELSTDTVEFTGKTLFLHDKATGGRCLHYHLLTNGHTCGLTISDVTVQGGTVFNPVNPLRQRTSVDLRNDILGRDQAGRTSPASDATSITAHNADGLLHQALQDFSATSQSDLDVKTAAFLASQKDDYDTYTCTLEALDGTALGKIRVGDLITVTSAVMGLSASAQRIAHMRLKFNGGPGTGLWDAELELGGPVRRRARVAVPNRPPNPGQTPFEGLGQDTQADVDAWWTATEDRAKVQPSGPSVVTDTTSVTGTPPTHAFTQITAERDHNDSSPTREDETRVYIQHIPPSGAGAGRLRARLFAWSRITNLVPTEELNWVIWQGEWSGSPLYSSIGYVLGNGSLVSAAFDATDMPVGGYVDIDIILPVNDGKFQFILGFNSVVVQDKLNAINDALTINKEISRWPATEIDSQSNDIVWMIPDYTTHISNDPTHYNPTTGYFIDWLPNVTPITGQWVFDETPSPAADGSTVAFTTQYAYQPGSLRVRVDGNAQNVTETSPSTGVFTLPWAPATGDEIRVDYMGTG